MMNCPKKELGQITTTINGLWTGKKPPFINIAVIRNTNFSKDCRLKMDDVAMIDVEIKQFASRKLQMGDIIIEKSGGSDKQPVGRPVLFNIPEGDYSFSNFTSTLRVNDQGVILPKYLHKFLYKFYLTGKTAEMQSKTTGLRNLDFNAYRAIKVPVPSIEEQQRIVDELDLLTGIIDKKNAQLRDLDALAQSIFYEMFGDPSRNEKGWPVKNIADLFDVGSSKRVFESEWRDSGVPFYRAREIVRLSKGLPLEDPIFIDESLFSSYKEKYGIPAAGDIMVTGVGTLGVCYLVKEEDRFYFKDGNTLWFKDKHIANSRFIKDQYSTDFVKDQIKGNSHGATVGTYTIVNAKNTRVICPPVELQNEYVKKVQVVDMQKQLIEKSLSNTHSLLDSHMHNYFD